MNKLAGVSALCLSLVLTVPAFAENGTSSYPSSSANPGYNASVYPYTSYGVGTSPYSSTTSAAYGLPSASLNHGTAGETLSRYSTNTVAQNLSNSSLSSYGTNYSGSYRTYAADDNTTSNWGWLGLVGLIGLLGFAGRNKIR